MKLRILAVPAFVLQSIVIKNNTEIEVTGNSFVHPILTEVLVQDISSELSMFPHQMTQLPLINQRRRNHVTENVDGKDKRINDNNDR